MFNMLTPFRNRNGNDARPASKGSDSIRSQECSSWLRENHAHVVQTRNEAAAVNFLAAARAVREADDVRAGLAQTAFKGDALRVIRQRHESRFAIAVVAHQNHQLAAAIENSSAVVDEHRVAVEERG